VTATAPPTGQRGLSGAFLRYRILAFVTGVLLVLLCFVAIPLKYLADHPGPVSVIGTAHGFLFMVYLVTALDLGVRLRWPWLKLGLVMLAGTVPFASFVAERLAHRDVQARIRPDRTSLVGSS
jgi:integral membrane protein